MKRVAASVMVAMLLLVAVATSNAAKHRSMWDLLSLAMTISITASVTFILLRGLVGDRILRQEGMRRLRLVLDPDVLVVQAASGLPRAVLDGEEMEFDLRCDREPLMFVRVLAKRRLPVDGLILTLWAPSDRDLIDSAQDLWAVVLPRGLSLRSMPQHADCVNGVAPDNLFARLGSLGREVSLRITREYVSIGPLGLPVSEAAAPASRAQLRQCVALARDAGGLT